MGRGGLCWSLVLAGLPFAHFLNFTLPLWHAHAAWLHAGLAVLLGLSVATPAPQRVGNPWLGAFIGWPLLFGSWLFLKGIELSNTYNLNMLMPMMHLTTIWVFYDAFLRLLDGHSLPQVLRWVARAGVGVMGYCVLQLLQFDQFYGNVDRKLTDLMVGTMGNPTHLASYLAVLLPLLMLQTGRRWTMLVGLNLFLLLMTKSVGGYLAGGAAFLWCGWHLFHTKRMRWMLEALVVVSAAVGSYLLVTDNAFINTSGRWMAWHALYQLYRDHHVTLGMGPGFVRFLSATIETPSHPLYHWGHAHNEFLQMLVEYGVPGFVALVGGVVASIRLIWQLPKTRQVVCLSGAWLAFCLNSLVSYPAHLWMVGSVGLAAYAGLHLIASEMADGTTHAG